MSPVLLDTNAFAMVLSDDPRLPEPGRAAILGSGRPAISAITFYEIGQKVRLGKWDAMAPFVPQLIDIALADGFDVIPLSPSHALKASLLDWDHCDPFDRMIGVVALTEGADLVSSNGAFDALGGVRRIWR